MIAKNGEQSILPENYRALIEEKLMKNVARLQYEQARTGEEMLLNYKMIRGMHSNHHIQEALQDKLQKMNYVLGQTFCSKSRRKADTDMGYYKTSADDYGQHTIPSRTQAVRTPQKAHQRRNFSVDVTQEQPTQQAKLKYENSESLQRSFESKMRQIAMLDQSFSSPFKTDPIDLSHTIHLSQKKSPVQKTKPYSLYGIPAYELQNKTLIYSRPSMAESDLVAMMARQVALKPQIQQSRQKQRLGIEKDTWNSAMPARTAQQAQKYSHAEDVNRITRDMYNYQPSLYLPHPNTRTGPKFVEGRNELVLDMHLRDKKQKMVVIRPLDLGLQSRFKV